MTQTTATFERGLSLRLKLSIGLILIIGITFAGTNTWNLVSSRGRQLDQALAAAETTTLLIATALTPELASTDIDSERFRNSAANYLNGVFTARQRDLAFVAIVDTNNKVIAGRARPELTLFPGDKTLSTESDVLNEVARLQGKLGGDMRTNRFPLVVSSKGSVGRLLVGTSRARLMEETRQDLIFNASVLIAALAVLILYATLALGRLVVTPLRKVVSAMRAVQNGDLSQTIDFHRRDEMGELASTYNFMIHGLKERAHLQDAFNRYVSPQVYERVKAGAINLRGELRQATVLFSDIRSFTTLSEQLTPVEVVAMLNEYFTDMVEIVFKNDGYVNKFIGDAIMAIYNAPLDQPEHELHAVRTALDMMHALDKLNQRRQARGQFPIKIGIGINTGPVVAGNLGHERRLEYTVIGDTVNLAQRLESQTKVAGAPVLISQSTHAACADRLIAQELPPVKVKGKAEPVVLYAVTGIREGDTVRMLPNLITTPPPATAPVAGAPPPAKAAPPTPHSA
jgi:class 3 adenylate cyclase